LSHATRGGLRAGTGSSGSCKILRRQRRL